VRFDRSNFFFVILVSFPFVSSLPGIFVIKQYVTEKEMVENYSLMKIPSAATGLSYILSQ
jgi:hypothetical protein